MEEITIYEVCKILKVSIARVYQLADEGKLIRYRKFNRSVFDKAEILELLEPKAVKK